MDGLRARVRFHIVDEVSPACSAASVVTITYDGSPLPEVSVPCGPTIAAPPPSTTIEGPWVEVGIHHLVVHVRRPSGAMSSTEARLSLPALGRFDDGGGLFIGAEITVRVAEESVHISPPLPTEVPGV